jgi:4-amino-4-deoxy-L-arabinose transferase-like glycosyltransferase
LAWRVGYTVAVHGDDSRLFDEGDAYVYSAVADETADGHWYRDPYDGEHFADHPPLTVAVLVPASAVFRDSVLAKRLTMSVLGGVAVVVLVGLAGRAVGGPGAGVGAAVVAAVNPNLWMNDALVMSESVAAVLIASIVLVGLALLRRRAVDDGEPSSSPSPWLVAAAGALCGLAALCRAELGLFLPLLVVPAIGARRWKLVAVAMAAGALTVAPWSAWNAAELHRPVLLSTNDGTTLLGANCPDTYVRGEVGTWSVFCVIESERVGRVGAGLDASDVAARQRAAALRYVRAHLGRVPLVLLAREGRTFGFWRPDQQVRSNRYEGRPTWASWAGYAVFWLLVPLSVVGAWRLRRRGVPLLPFAACAVVAVVVPAVFYGLPRFRLPLDVATCVLGGYALASTFNRLTASSSTSRRLQKAKRTSERPAVASS